MNGDALNDAVWLGDDWMKVYLGRGDGTFETRPKLDYPWADATFDLSDIRIADLNQDGLMDLVRVTAGNVYWWAGRVGGFDEDPTKLPRPPDADYDDIVSFADLNGNGSVDVVWSGPFGTWILDLAGPGGTGQPTEGMLTSVENGFGQTLSIAYSTTVLLSLAAAQQGQTWTERLPKNISVPVEMTVNTGWAADPDRVSRTTVRNGFWDAEERRFGGFLGVQQRAVHSDPTNELVTTTEFHRGTGDRRVLRGLAFRGLSQDATGEIFSETLSAHDALAMETEDGSESLLFTENADNSLLRRAVTVETTTETYEGQPDSVTTFSESFFNYLGDGTEERNYGFWSGDEDTPGDETVAARTLAYNDETWLRAVPCEVETRELDGTVVERSRMIYDRPLDAADAADPDACRGLTRGWPTATFGFVDTVLGEPAAWIRLTETSYDGLGNPVIAYSDGVTRRLTYGALGIRAEGETVEPTPGFALTWSMDWDYGLVIPFELSDPNGDKSRVVHDALARLVEVWGDEDSDGALERLASTEYECDTFPPATRSRRYEAGLLPDGESVAYFNGAGEALYQAALIDDGYHPDWTVSGWTDRDERGRRTFLYRPFFANAVDANVAPELDHPGWSFGYDAMDRTVVSVLPTGFEQRTTYRPFEIEVDTDKLSPITRRLDGLGRVQQTERFIAELETVDATYDAAGRLLEYSLQNGAAVHAFAYDTLGRLRHATDPDIGERRVVWNDRNFIVKTLNAELDEVRYAYDGAGRLVVRRAIKSSGAIDESFLFQYDTTEASLGSPGMPYGGRTKGRLASVIAQRSEPSGAVTQFDYQALWYDAVGRTRRMERSIADSAGLDHTSIASTNTYSPSGLVLGSQVFNLDAAGAFAHRLSLTQDYDAAGQLRRVDYASDATNGALYELVEFNAAGEPLVEHRGNGTVGLFERDERGQSVAVRTGATGTSGFVWDPVGHVVAGDAAGVRAAVAPDNTLYGVGLTRNAYGAVTDVVDTTTSATAAPLPRGAMFTYDGAARLTDANVGGYRFEYEYDGLQNMFRREITTPTAASPMPDVKLGVYAYGEGNAGAGVSSPGGTGPRQLTSVAGATAFAFDKAGRRVKRLAGGVGQSVVFDAFDRIRSVSEDGDEVVRHTYGSDGERILTEHLDATGAVVAREKRFGGGLQERNGRFEQYIGVGDRSVARLDYALLPVAGGAELKVGHLHSGFGPGPTLRTDAAGELVEERLFTPFGALLTRWDSGGGSEDNDWETAYSVEPLSWVNKEVDRATGWSDHGARWYASRTGRWLAPDPPVKGPRDVFLRTPWKAHPYQYVSQNPVEYWDPDGRWEDPGGGNANASTTRAAELAERPGTKERLRKQRRDKGLTDEGRCPSAGCNVHPRWNDAWEVVVEVAQTVSPDPFSKLSKGFKLLRKAFRRGSLPNSVSILPVPAARPRLGASKAGTSGGKRAGKRFTPKGKREIDAENARRHGGTNVCEDCGVDVVPGKRSQKGVTPPRNERQRDHIIPKSKGGDGDPTNGQVLCRGCNLEKSDK